MNQREQEIIEAQADSCLWILQNESYINWKKNMRGILGIRGIPGSGKSTLMKKIFKVLSSDETQDTVKISFFYHGRGSEIQHSQIGMFRTLLHQLLSKVPSAGAEFRKLVEEKEKWQGIAGQDWNWSLADLRQVFSVCLLTAASMLPSLVVFVDALDEAGTESAEAVGSYLCDMNEKLVQSGANVRICFSSRYFPVIPVARGSIINVEDYNKEDMSRYIFSELRKKLEFDGHSTTAEFDSELASLHSKILEQASGIFMWVVLVVPMVAEQHNDGASTSEILQSLLEVPLGLHALYQHILTKVVKQSNLPRTLHVIQWIFLAMEPLSVADLRFAIASDDTYMTAGQNSCKESKGFIENDTRMKKLVNSLTGGLAVVKKHNDELRGEQTTVQFIHQSVNDFLSTGQFKFLQPNAPLSATGEAHDRLRRSCINYIKLERTRWSEISMTESTNVPFCKYAVKFWFLHAKEAEMEGVQQKDLINQLEWPLDDIFRDWVKIHSRLNINNPLRLITGVNVLDISSYSGLDSVVADLLSQGVDIQERDEEGNSAMHYAARGGKTSIVEKLSSNDSALVASKNTAQDTPLSVAAQAGHISIVRFLLGLGEDINESTGNSGNALQVAARSGKVAVVHLLLQMRANFNAQGGQYGNALQAGAQSGSEAVVQLLLTAGADVNAQGGYYGNALQAGAQNGSEAVVQLLLKAGADVNAQGGKYGSALQVGALSGSESVVQLLLTAGADVNTQGGYYGSALQAGALSGLKAVVQLLLTAGADVNAQGGYYGNALQAASASFQNPGKMTQLLLDAGAVHSSNLSAAGLGWL
jgi:ankyrin repeat protein